MNKNIYDYTKQHLEDYFSAQNMQKFRATQVIEGLYRQLAKSFSEIKGLKKDVQEQMSQDFSFVGIKLVEKHVSNDQTTKYLFELEEGSLIETVLMIQSYGYSVCVSTQVGCNMGCAFCASGQVKRVRNLTVSEMVMQVLYIHEELLKIEQRVSHVVLMGIGEPFDNYDNVLDFIRLINEPKGLAIGARHITISTCGIIPKILKFAEFPLQVNLAISLHFANDEKRTKYMKINKQYPLQQLIDALQTYYEKTNRRITFEYILLKDINDSIADAKQLVQLIRGLNCYVNLIPYNDTGVFKRASEEQTHAFFDFLQNNKINAIVRKEQGHDIAAACGQLRVSKMVSEWKKD